MGKFCTNCGAETQENQEKCSYCGKVLKPSETPKAEENVQSETSNVNYNNQTSYNQNYQTSQNNQVPGQKSKMAAGLLGIFFGAFGVHNFYLGYTGKAVAQLLITVLSCCVLSEVSALWGLIEGILILCGSINTDGNGNPLGD